MVYNLLLYITLKACNCTLYLSLYIFEQMKFFIEEISITNIGHPSSRLLLGTAIAGCLVYIVWRIMTMANIFIKIVCLSCIALQRCLLQRCVRIIVILTLLRFLNLNMKFPCLPKCTPWRKQPLVMLFVKKCCKFVKHLTFVFSEKIMSFSNERSMNIECSVEWRGSTRW